MRNHRKPASGRLDWVDYMLTVARLLVLDCLAPMPETPVDGAIREESERVRKAFPWLDERRPRPVRRMKL
jgi:hypothetical protein